MPRFTAQSAKKARDVRVATQNGDRRRFKDEVADDMVTEQIVKEDEAHYAHYLRTGEWLSPRPFPHWKR